ncbi:hypothetical protein HMPREF3156_02322 [Neisseria sp. HMSC06F02]|nr:hypothetical protein HMPREF3156_02322 [Neisseria sp. HMSC06F02]
MFEDDGFLVEDDVFETDEFESAPDVRFGRRGFGTRVAAEMVCIKVPQHLDGGVERAVCQGVDVAANAQQGEEIGRRVVQTTFFVQSVDQAVFAVEAEDFFEAGNFCEDFVDEDFGFFAVNAEEAELGAGTQRDAFPNDGLADSW